MAFLGQQFRNALARKEALVTIALLAPIIFAALFADFTTPYSPLRTGVGPPLKPPSTQYWMGTDQAGGDIFSQVVYGSRVALFVGILSTLLALVIAIFVGLAAGYYGGVIDEALMRVTDLVLSIPSFVLIIFIVVLFGSRLNVIMLVIGAVSWPTLARIIRAQVLSLREQEFVLAARAVGASSRNLMFDEILPNVWAPLLPAVMLQLGFAVLIEVGLSFLGLGDPNASSWGKILWLASRSIYLGAWWSVLLPGLAIIVTVLGFNTLGDVLSRTVNPREARGG
jgi:peptide/nickel transport system permease protein